MQSTDAITVGEEIENRFSRFANLDAPKIVMHDFIHILTHTQEKTLAGEMASAIYQAVLLRDMRVVVERIHIPKNGWSQVPPCPQLSDFKSDFFTRIKSFFTKSRTSRSARALKEFPAEVFKELNGNEIQKHYSYACALDRHFFDQYGKYFCQFSADEVKALPLDEVKALWSQVDADKDLAGFLPPHSHHRVIRATPTLLER